MVFLGSYLWIGMILEYHIRRGYYDYISLVHEVQNLLMWYGGFHWFLLLNGGTFPFFG